MNADGSVYHLNLLPGDIADTVITVGDPDRVEEVSRHFDRIELKKGKREFITHTGYIGNKRLTVLSTGIGTDNIDIVFNELDALANINFETRTVNAELRSLNIIRIGTSGAVQSDIPVDSLLVSAGAFGLDALMHYYLQQLLPADAALLNAFTNSLPAAYQLKPYFAPANGDLLNRIAHDLQQGITITAPGFYAPQGRQVRAQSLTPQLMASIQGFSFNTKRITNLEMETAGIYGLANSLGHKALSFNVILANRANLALSKQPAEIMQQYIGFLIDRIITL